MHLSPTLLLILAIGGAATLFAIARLTADPVVVRTRR